MESKTDISNLKREGLNFYTPFNGMRDFMDAHSESTYTTTEMVNFLQFVDNNKYVRNFLKMDKYCIAADKYHMATVFNYFMKADYRRTQLSAFKFFVALHLAHDIMEDTEDLKVKFCTWALGDELTVRDYVSFIANRDILWKKIDFHAIVSKSCCDKIMSLCPNHHVWNRNRLSLAIDPKEWSENYINPNFEAMDISEEDATSSNSSD